MIITGLGQCSLDYLALIDVYPPVDTKKEVLEWYEQGGGPVATALAALSRLGISCRFYGIVGDDDAGEKIRRSLVAEGIDTKGVVKRERAASQIAFIAVEKDTARRTIFWRRPSGQELKIRELGKDFLSGSGFLLLDGLMEEVSLHAAKKARERTIPVMLDAGRMRRGILALARSCDYVVASEEFARDLGLKLEAETVQRWRKAEGISVLTITSGERGSITASEKEVFHVPAFSVHAVDTTGAGDVFHGGYIYGIVRGWSLRDTVLFASAMAALKCTRIGGRAGIPMLHDVMEFLTARGHGILQP